MKQKSYYPITKCQNYDSIRIDVGTDSGIIAF